MIEFSVCAVCHLPLYQVGPSLARARACRNALFAVHVYRAGVVVLVCPECPALS